MPFDEAGFLNMHPLSRLKPTATTNWGEPNAMALRPTLAAKVAHCIAHWSEIEIQLGTFLALLLHANEKAALAMYSALENRSAQLLLIEAAAEASLDAAHFNVIATILRVIIRPAMRERDKLAHWTWGYSIDLPDTLLIAEPASTLQSFMAALKLQRTGNVLDVPTDFNRVYVVRPHDLDEILKRSHNAKNHLRVAMGTVWDWNPPELRASYLQELSNVPQIQEALKRQSEPHKNNPEAQQPSPPKEPNG
jgi:hypothetical protein